MPTVKIAVVALLRDGCVLMVHRTPQRASFPNCWDLPGGHVERGENADDAARRELREEIGVEVGELSSVVEAAIAPDVVKLVFQAVDWSGEANNLAPDEHDDLRWIPLDELPFSEMCDSGSLRAVARAWEAGLR